MSAPNKAGHQPEPLFPKDDVPETLGWVKKLTASHLRMFAAEISEFSKDGGADEELAALLARWRATAQTDDSDEVEAHLARTRRGRLSINDQVGGYDANYASKSNSPGTSL